MTARTYQAEQVAELLGVSTWAIYESVRRGECPVEPIRVGRRLVWPRATVDRLLGITPVDDETRAAHARVPSNNSTPTVTNEEDRRDSTPPQ